MAATDRQKKDYDVRSKTWRTVAAYHCLPTLRGRHSGFVQLVGDRPQREPPSPLSVNTPHDRLRNSRRTADRA
jgi:hypothetical protein